ncbi:MAG TPA: SIR2 family protein [Thermoanaerobaculia bacterium]
MAETKDWLSFAAHMLPLPSGVDAEARTRHSRQMLFRALNLKTTIAVVGSGCSVPLGYPTWSGFTEQVLSETIQALGDASGDAGRLTEYARALKDAPRSQENSMMLFIGACQEVLERNKRRDVYQAYMERTFGKWKENLAKGKLANNPYDELIGLPIHRFVTTNYDCEIEGTLLRQGLVPPGSFPIPKPPETRHAEPGHGHHQLSFDQKSENFDELSLFALGGVRDNLHMVFHCHGRYDDVDSIIASERDYQKWYIMEGNGAATAFRQSVELLLASNPLLFVGYSLRDDDLLRPLRHIGAIDPLKKKSRPIFALLESAKGDSYNHEMLYERYGLHVIAYETEDKTPAGRTAALCRELRGLKEGWETARGEWLLKPSVRRPQAARDKPTPHLELKPTPVPLGRLETFEAEVREPGIIGLIGPSGCGKSLHCLRLMESLKPEGGALRFDGAFYWNLHYGNEFLTAVDTMLDYFDPGGDRALPRDERMRRCLAAGRYLLILDGCERLLCKSDGGPWATSYSPLFRQLLRVFADAESRSTVVLAGRTLPSELEAVAGETGGARPRILNVKPLTSADLQSTKLFSGLRIDKVSALCSVLKGHNFGLLTAKHYFEALHPDEREPRLDKLIVDLADRTQDQRLRKMIQVQLQGIDARMKGLAKPFLERLALFLSPVCDETLQICYDKAVDERREVDTTPHPLGERQPAPSYPPLDELREALLASDFLFETQGRDGTRACTVHATVRSQLFQAFHGQSPDALPDFGFSGFLSGRIGIDPGGQAYRQVQDLFAAIDERAQEALGKTGTDARNLCRDAFSLLRGRMETNTAARWCNSYEEYVRLGIRTAKLAKQVTAEHWWRYCEHGRLAQDAEDPESPLYVAELAWLYNDVALALSAQGYVRDAYSVWEQTYEISRLVEAPETGSELEIESLLSLTMCFIEMGRLPAARKLLEQIGRSHPDLLDDEVRARVDGLRGLIHHLHGNLPRAADFYERCTKRLSGSPNLRAQSLFIKHQADLNIAMGDFPRARMLIRTSRALAEGGVFPDLVLLTRVTEGHLLTNENRPDAARIEYGAVLREARRLGMRKQEAEIEFSLARLALREGDAESARQLAMKSLTIANELGLGLRVTHSLVVLGLAMLEARERQLAVAYLSHGKKLADEQEYWHRSWEAERKLQELGETA